MNAETDVLPANPRDLASMRGGRTQSVAPPSRGGLNGSLFSQLGVIGVIVIIAVGILPIFYVLAAQGSAFAVVLTDGSGPHIMLNAAATGLVMLWSLRLAGRLDRKLAGVINRVLLVHGVFAFEILITRQFHSNKVMLVAAVTSLVLGSAVMLLGHVAKKPRIAVLGRRHSPLEQIPETVDYIADPSQSLEPYDILLTFDILDLSAEWSRPLAKAMLLGKQVRHVAEFIEESQGTVSVEHFDLEQIPASRLTTYRFRKRLLDVGLVLITAPVALVVLAAGALSVLITMGTPILFTQERLGLGSKPFTIYKLRTMRIPSERGSAQTTSKDDLRITSAGRILRRFRIDELPQLWNVLIGDMSIVGPRPEWTELGERYTKSFPAYTYRHLVRPGITGWAQVRGGYAADLAETRVKVGYDLFYIKNLSFTLDVQILARTVWTLLSGSGAR